MLGMYDNDDSGLTTFDKFCLGFAIFAMCYLIGFIVISLY